MTPPPMGRRGYILMIHLFLDDSGKDGQQTNPWVCMAGYLAPYQPYVSLIGKWQSLLTVHGITEIHMKDLIPIEGQYKKLGWDVAKRDAVVADFIHAINETRMFGVGVALEIATWRKLKKKHSSLPWGSAQEFCAQRIMKRVVTQLANAGMDETLSLVFDTDPEFGPGRFNLFCALMGQDDRAARRLASITFGHPEYYPGLQAADMLAWETRKELMQKRDGHVSTKRWQAMFPNMPDYHLEYTVGERWDEDFFRDAMPEILANFSA